jgi:hypothetical protein
VITENQRIANLDQYRFIICFQAQSGRSKYKELAIANVRFRPEGAVGVGKEVSFA